MEIKTTLFSPYPSLYLPKRATAQLTADSGRGDKGKREHLFTFDRVPQRHGHSGASVKNFHKTKNKSRMTHIYYSLACD